VARRDARRAKGRAALVVAIIAVPVAAVAFVAVDYDSFRLRADEQADRVMGQTQAVMTWRFSQPVHQFWSSPDGYPVGAGKAASPTDAEAQHGVDQLLALLPAGTTAIADDSRRLSMRTASGTGTIDVRLLDYPNPLAHGMFTQLSGSPPTNADQAVLTPKALRRLGVSVGGDVRLADGSRTFRVVGVVEDPSNLDATTVVLPAGALPPVPDDHRTLRWLVATPGPVTWAQVKQLNTAGVTVASRYVLAHPPSEGERYPEFQDGPGPGPSVLALVGGLAMLEIILLAGPAFAVGARRRSRDLALVAASGGTPAQLRRIVLADGVVLGTVAALAGVGLGVVVGVTTLPLFENLSHARAGGVRVFPAALGLVAAVALATGVLAALVPAWTSARQDVVTALAGRRGVTRSRRRWVVVGLAMLAVGTAVLSYGAVRANSTVILAGLAVAELGLVFCTPAAVGLLARFGRVLPLAARIALRDTARNRAAAAPAVSAVMAAVVGSIAAGVILAASDQRAQDSYQAAGRIGEVTMMSVDTGVPSQVPSEAIATLRAVMPVEQVYQVNEPSCTELCVLRPLVPAARACPYDRADLRRAPSPAEQRAARRDPRCDPTEHRYSYFGVHESLRPETFVIDAAAVRAVIDIPEDDLAAAVAALRSGAVVVDDPKYLDNGKVTLGISTISTGRDGPEQTVTANGFALPHGSSVPVVLMTEATARSLGLGSSPLVTVAITTRVPTQEEEDRLEAALGTGYWSFVERGRQTNNTPLLVLAIVAGVITLGAAAIATGLAAADGRADLGTLAAVGASPRVRRMLSLSQSGVIAGLGSFLGAAAGLGASVAVLFALNQQYASVWPSPPAYPIRVPWLNVGVALVVVPVVAMLGAGLLTRSRLPIERRL
jgi:putative ABC transport system permease protein